MSMDDPRPYRRLLAALFFPEGWRLLKKVEQFPTKENLREFEEEVERIEKERERRQNHADPLRIEPDLQTHQTL